MITFFQCLIRKVQMFYLPVPACFCCRCRCSTVAAVVDDGADPCCCTNWTSFRIAAGQCRRRKMRMRRNWRGSIAWRSLSAQLKFFKPFSQTNPSPIRTWRAFLTLPFALLLLLLLLLLLVLHTRPTGCCARFASMPKSG